MNVDKSTEQYQFLYTAVAFLLIYNYLIYPPPVGKARLATKAKSSLYGAFCFRL